MDSLDQRAATHRLIAILRKTTRYVQWIPIVYLAVYSISAFSEQNMTEEFLCLRDSVAAVSPAVNVLFLCFSHLLNLCRWHKVACLIPLQSTVVDYIDNYLFQFTQDEMVMLNLLAGITSVVFIILANHHFFAHTV